MKDWASFVNTPPGGRITINGEDYPVHEVVTYCHLVSNEMWVNLMTRIGNREVAVEAVMGEINLTLWRRIPKIRGLTAVPDVLKYRGEKYSLAEKGVALAVVKTAKGTETATVPYHVFQAESGRRIAVEVWDDQPQCYIAEATPPQVSF